MTKDELDAILKSGHIHCGVCEKIITGSIDNVILTAVSLVGLRRVTVSTDVCGECRQKPLDEILRVFAR